MKNNDNQLRRACSLLWLEAFLSKQVQGPSVQGKALHQPPGVSAGLSGPAAGRLQPAPAVPAVTELCTRSPGTLEIPSFTTPQRRREIAPWSGRGSRPGGHVRDFSNKDPTSHPEANCIRTAYAKRFTNFNCSLCPACLFKGIVPAKR